MPAPRPRRGGRAQRPGQRARGKGNGARLHPAQPREKFQTSRLRDTGDDSASDSVSEPADQSATNDPDDLGESSEEDSPPDGEPNPAQSYAVLLQSLKSQEPVAEPSRKRRKLAASLDSNGNPIVASQISHPTQKLEPELAANEFSQVLEEPGEEGEDIPSNLPDDVDSEDEERVLSDPFEKHYSMVTEQEVKDAVNQVNAKEWESQNSISAQDTRLNVLRRRGAEPTALTLTSSKDHFLKRRLADCGSKLISSLSQAERTLASNIFGYTDVLNGGRNLRNLTVLRDMCCLHALNHIFKTRDRVLKNNSKYNAQDNSDALDVRDQGFTRPKVLIMVPTKQACVRVVDSIVKLSAPDQQENKSRFLETYSREDDDEWANKPDDFIEVFGGNHEEDFRIGLKFTRKTIKYFSGFYNSDIIIGSPLGLMRTVTTGGGGKDKKKTHDADFLSSIEVVIVDNASALQMQNWSHVDYVFSQLNLLPKDSHGCDFSRVRHWYLDGHAKYLRQTVVLSSYLTPEINSLMSNHTFNIAGRAKFQPTYRGAMLSISAVLPLSITQTFQRFACSSPASDADARFRHFTSAVLPPLLRDKHLRGCLFFVPTYADFTRLRNYMATSSDTTNLSFGSVSEYTPRKDVLRARSHFLGGRHGVLMYSERAHHHFRYRLKGVRKILFYGVPENPIFWGEILSLLELGFDLETDKSGLGKGAVKALFSKWDAMKLERIVGTERVGRLLNERGDTFEFA